MERHTDTKILVALGSALLVIAVLVGIIAGRPAEDGGPYAGNGGEPPKSTKDAAKKLSGNSGFVAFESAEDFFSYIEKSDGLSYGGGAVRTLAFPTADVFTEGSTAAPLSKDGAGAIAPDRVSETNVQVVGIDEPDIVKTDGTHIYYSSQLLHSFSLLLKDSVTDSHIPL